MALEILSMPVISISHIDLPTNLTLSKKGDQNDWCTCASYEYGYFVHLGELTQPGTPQCLHDIKKWLDASGHGESEWVRLEQAAEPVPGLPVYDW